MVVDYGIGRCDFGNRAFYILYHLFFRQLIVYWHISESLFSSAVFVSFWNSLPRYAIEMFPVSSETTTATASVACAMPKAER